MVRIFNEIKKFIIIKSFRIKELFFSLFFHKFFPPDVLNYWTTIYYGARGSGKTLHQAKMTKKVLRYWKWYYNKNIKLPKPIIFTNQNLSDNFLLSYKEFCYHWGDANELKYCPRKNCWLEKKKHKLHNALIIFDDISNILPPDNWRMTPSWLRKIFLQGRHFGIRCFGSMITPENCDINFRRCCDVAFKFSKIFGNADPDVTKKPIKFVFGIYRMRKINADLLWQVGDLPEQSIRMAQVNQEQQNEYLKTIQKEWAIVYDDSWKGSLHFWRIHDCEIYDTHQDVQEFEPQGFSHKEIKCIDPTHNHTDKKAANYCGFTKVYHELK